MKACLVPCVEPTWSGYEHGSSSRCLRASNIGFSCAINSSAKRTNTKPGNSLGGKEYIRNKHSFCLHSANLIAGTRRFINGYETVVRLVHTFSRRPRGLRNAGMMGSSGKGERNTLPKNPYALTCHLSNAVDPMSRYTNKQHQRTTRACASMHSLNTLMQYDQMLRAQHMLYSRQCTLHMYHQIHVQVAREKAEKKMVPKPIAPSNNNYCALYVVIVRNYN